MTLTTFATSTSLSVYLTSVKMGDAIGGPDESARLWRVNRTIHELVRDRVRAHRLCGGRIDRLNVHSRDSKSQTMK